MKGIIRSFLFHIVALWFTTQLLPSLVIIGNWQTIVGAGIVLTLLTLFIQPLLKILFIPINFLTLGLASWLIDVILLWLLTVVVPQVQVRAWDFAGVSAAGFRIPPMHVSYGMSLIITTLFLMLITGILRSVSEE
ncbi:phage holin family protein [Candidatus Gottesmanbacteria bacterium]|nr:phage holin family protein [Candidatus Gottesmanbacteria bacterium]